MAAILRVKDDAGNLYDITAIRGPKGDSAYQVAVKNGFTGTEAEWIKSLNYPSPIIVLDLEGTPAKYKDTMRQFFAMHGANDGKDITTICNKWYEGTRTGWSGYTKFLNESSLSTGIKGGDNAGRNCTPSTETVENVDDYKGHPLFAIVDCNYEIDPTTLDIRITAIDGVAGNFGRYNPAKFVGVLQMTPWHYYDEDETSYTHGVTDAFEPGHMYCQPVPEAVKLDGTVRPWVVHSKYMSSLINGKMTSCSGVFTRGHTVSHNTLHTNAANTGVGYSGGTAIDWAFLQLMTIIKYGMTLDGIVQGCVNYNKQSYAIAAETGTNRVILSDADAAYFEVGSVCLVGNYTTSNDRGNNSSFNLSSNFGARIKSKSAVTVGDITGTALYFEVMDSTTGALSEPSWDTGANGNATAGTTIVSTYAWPAGTNDKILGNDGSKDAPGSGKYPGTIQGIEFAVGVLEVMADIILNQDAEYYYAFICNTVAKQSTSITADYVDIGIKSRKNSEKGGWEFIRKLGFAKGVFFGTETTGASSSTFTRDAFYKNGTNTTSGQREMLAFGRLNFGTGAGGLSYLTGNLGLGYALWNIGSRLSPNGNRGELVT